MATITVNVASKKEANKVLANVYTADSSATYSGKKAVNGSAISAIYRPDKNQVEISSNYFLESSLTEMFSKNK